MVFVSEEYSLIFVHIPKNGGTSVENSLKNISENFAERKILSPHLGYWEIKYLLKKHYRKNIENYEVFTVFRDPIDRIVSVFNWCMKKYTKYIAEMEKNRNQNSEQLKKLYEEIKNTKNIRKWFWDLPYAPFVSPRSDSYIFYRSKIAFLYSQRLYQKDWIEEDKCKIFYLKNIQDLEKYLKDKTNKDIKIPKENVNKFIILKREDLPKEDEEYFRNYFEPDYKIIEKYFGKL